MEALARKLARQSAASYKEHVYRATLSKLKAEFAARSMADFLLAQEEEE